MSKPAAVCPSCPAWLSAVALTACPCLMCDRCCCHLEVVVSSGSTVLSICRNFLILVSITGPSQHTCCSFLHHDEACSVLVSLNLARSRKQHFCSSMTAAHRCIAVHTHCLCAWLCALDPRILPRRPLLPRVISRVCSHGAAALEGDFLQAQGWGPQLPPGPSLATQQWTQVGH